MEVRNKMLEEIGSEQTEKNQEDEEILQKMREKNEQDLSYVDNDKPQKRK